MASYVVMMPPDDGRGEDALFVRDGFAPLALVLPVVWFLWHRLWLWAAAFLVIAIVANVMMERDGLFYAGLALSVCASFFAGLEAQALRVAARERQGWRVAAVIDAPDAGAAEAMFFASPHLAAAPAPAEAETIGPHRVSQRPLPQAPLGPRRSPAQGIFEWNGGR